jgi:hypothetical protein
VPFADWKATVVTELEDLSGLSFSAGEGSLSVKSGFEGGLSNL